jgi:hypothetical protein
VKLLYTTLLGILLVFPACNRNDNEPVRAGNDTTATDQLKQQRDDYVKSINCEAG